MKRIILSTLAITTLSAALVGCGFYQKPELDKNGTVGVVTYDGKVAHKRDVVVYRKDPKHVFVFDGVRYRIKPYNNRYVYYRI